ncbi:MAG: glucosamine-6-phosphate deaminase [Tissierellia bacterium]|nr:glucosamine-6-phosphate deaminase [Tissierellia bacterium]
MEKIIKTTYEEVSKLAADIFIDVIRNKKDAVIGLATGSTPIGMYEELAKAYEKGVVSFKNVTSFNLDEYVGLDPKNETSYRYFMNEYLFNKVDININNTYVPIGKEEGIEEACKEYEELIAKHGPVDIQLLGVGEDGHIAFNEPGEYLHANTNVTVLAQETREVNSRFFNSVEEVPTKAITMGMGTILKAKRIVLIANGEKKRAVMERLFADDTVSTDFPISFLKLHPDATIICDRAAYPGK